MEFADAIGSQTYLSYSVQRDYSRIHKSHDGPIRSLLYSTGNMNPYRERWKEVSHVTMDHFLRHSVHHGPYLSDATANILALSSKR